MTLIAIKDIEPGMILENDLRTPQGRMVLPEGAVIADAHLKVCRTWGITEADVSALSDTVQDKTNNDRPLFADARKIAEKHFAHTDRSHPATAALFRLYTSYLVDYAQQSGNDSQDRETNSFPPAAPLPSMSEISMVPGIDPSPLGLDFILNLDPALASLPDVFSQINDALKNPRSTAAYLAEIVSRDANLASKLLRVVNSSFYGLPNQIDTLSRAVTILGTNQLSNLALGITVIDLFPGVPQSLLDMRSFWKHSLCCALCARLIAGQHPGITEEKLFLAGLLHDMGRLVLLKLQPHIYVRVMRKHRKSGMSLPDIERQAWGYSHADLGGELLRRWMLPASLENCVRYHHRPQLSPQPLEASIINIADSISISLSMGSSGSFFAPNINDQAWKTVGIPKTMLPLILTQVHTQLHDIFRIFFGSENG